MLDGARWERVCDLVGQALEMSAEDRPAFIADCDQDREIRAEVASLLHADGSAGETFLRGDLLSPNVAAALASSSLVSPSLVSPWIDRVIGPYRVLDEIGHGGMGVVLRAARADALYERQVAIKVVRGDLAGELFLRRFRNEIRILAAFDHTGIARLLDAGVTDDGLPYLVMEFVAGVPIDRFCRESHASVETILKLVHEIAEAVSYAHALHVIHRDIKPGNIIVNDHACAKLLDFGIAKLVTDSAEEGGAATELRACTPAYASPEQLSGGAVTVQTDVYSLGVLLYVLLAGETPYCFDGLSPAAMERAFETTIPLAPSRVRAGSSPAGARRLRSPRPGPLLAGADAVVLKAIEVQPGNRYRSAAELATDLHRLLAGDAPLARLASPARRAAHWARRRRHTLALAGVAVAAVCVAFAGWYRLQIPPAHAAASALALRPSIAVLPFRNIGRERADDWISAAASEVVATELAVGDRVRVARSEDIAHAQQDLHLTDTADLVAPALAGLARNLDSQYLVSGSYLAESTPEEKHLRVNVALFDAKDRRVLSKRSFTGSEQQISALSTQIAESMLASIGVESQGSVAEAEHTLPQSPEAVRWYSEGRRHLRELDFVSARPAIERAAAIEDGSAVIHAALAETWEGLGNTRHAETEAARAVQLSAALPKRSRLTVEGEYRELEHDWSHATEIYGTLHDFFPDDLDYGLHLARDQAAARQTDQAIATLQAMEKLPPPLNGDPRIPLTEAAIAEASSRTKLEVSAADRALTLARERKATHEIAQALLEQARALHHIGRNQEAAALAQQAEQSFSKAGNQRDQGLALHAIGNFRESGGDYDGAVQAFDQARDLFVRIGYAWGLARTLNGLGNIAADRNQKHEALSFYEQSLALNRQLDDAGKIAGNLNNMANMELALYHPDRARELYQESYEMERSAQDRGGMAMARGNLAEILRSEGKLVEARRSDEEAFSIYKGLGLTQSFYWPVQGLARTALLEGDLARASTLYAQAADFSRGQGNQRQLAYALCNRAEVLGLIGDHLGQRSALDEGVRIRQALGEAENTASCELAVIRERLRTNDIQNPEQQIQAILTRLEHGSDPLILGEAQIVIAQLRMRLGQHALAAADLQRGRQLLATSKQNEEQRWEADVTESTLAVAQDQSRRQAARIKLAADISEAARLHNRPWQVRLELATAEAELHRDRTHGRALLQKVAAEAHALGAGSIEQTAQADLHEHTTV